VKFVPARSRDREGGVVLINVLAVLALASAVVAIMLASQQENIRRGQRDADTQRARALAEGGVTSAQIALRRDLSASPDIDHSSEPWGALAEDGAEIEGGRFSLSISDLQDRFNLNNLIRGGVAARQTFFKIADAAGVPRPVAEEIIRVIEAGGQLSSTRELVLYGIAPDHVVALAGFTTALPGRTKVNINASSEVLLGMLLQNPVRARVLIAQRDRQGFLAAEDVRRARVLLPGDLGYTSDFYRVEVEVLAGTARQRLAADLVRSTDNGIGRVEIRRQIWNAAVSSGTPPR